MKIYLSNSAWLINIDPFLKALDLDNLNTLEITTHNRWVSVHPMILSMIVSLGINIRNLGGTVICNANHRAEYYFKRMKVLDFLGIKSDIKIKEHESSGRFIPLRKISNQKELDDFIKELIPLLHKSKKDTESINYIISELVRNVLEHSEDKNGAIVCAQYYAKSNTVRIGVVDCGIGIRKSISKSHKTIDESHALELALTPGVTGTTPKIGGGGTEENAGAGLFFIKSIAISNRSFFMIYSGDSAYKLLTLSKNTKEVILNIDPKEDNHRKLTNLPFWKGTAIGIDICLNHSQDFSSLLNLIHAIYSKGKKEKTKDKYRKARFI